MGRQIIDTTTDHGSYKGDPAKVAFEKVNANDAELYGLVAGVAAVGGDNMLINCGVPINQRGFAGGALGAGVYGYDRWKAGSGGCNVTINATTGVFTHTSGPLQQIVESPVLAWGLPLTISVENPSGNITVSVGGATGTITSGSGRRGVTLTPSGSGNLTVQLTAAGVTYSRPKLERGAAATPYVALPQALELVLCQRYYEKSYNLEVKPGTSSSVGRKANSQAGVAGEQLIFCSSSFAVSKRSAPAVTVYAPNSGAAGRVGVNDNSDVPVTVQNIGVSGFELAWTPGAGKWGGWWQYAADAEL